ncbi:MAG: DNRLRE domain-containing protein [Myxococcaceae bacterium]
MNSVIFVLSAALAQATVTPLKPVADTSLDSRTGSASAGTATSISADQGSGWHKDAYLRFEVPANIGQVTKATLQLHVNNGSAGGGAIHLCRSAGRWSESSTGLPKDPAFPIAQFDELPDNAMLQRDVTSAVAAGMPLEIHISSATSDGLGFDSREGAQPPQLIITSLPVQKPAGAGLGAVVLAEADTYASQHNPTANHATDDTIFADRNDGLHEDLAFIRFPIAPARGDRKVTRATVRMFVTNGTVGRVSILPFGDVLGARWSETNLTWDKLPQHGVSSPMVPLVLQAVPENEWLDLDATEAAKSNDYLSLQIATATADGLGIASRESATNKPRLLLEFAPISCSATKPCDAGNTCLSSVCVQTCSAATACDPGNVCTAAGTCKPGLP